MQSLTDDCPKPMLPLGGRPMLAHQLERFQSAGIRKVCLIIGYKGEMVQEYFHNNPPAGIELEYVVQHKQDGTGSAALLARNFAANDSFLLTFGDILVDPGIYSDLMKLAAGAEIVLATKQVNDPYRGSAVYVSGNQVVKIIEKPPQGTSTTNYTGAGIYIFKSSIFNNLHGLEPSARGEYEITDAIESVVHDGKLVRCLEVTGFWRDVGRPEDLAPASDYVSKSFPGN